MICHSPSLAFLNPFAHAPAGMKTVRLIPHDQVGGRKMAELESWHGDKIPQCWFCSAMMLIFKFLNSALSDSA